MSKLLRRIVLFIWALFLLPVLGQFPISWLESIGVYKNPDVSFVILNLVATLGQNYWVQMVALGLGTLTLGAWLDQIARKLDDHESKEMRGLGWEFQLLADRAARAQNNFPNHSPRNVRPLQADLLSTLLSAKNFGLWVPGPEIYQRSNPEFLVNYLKLVGTLLHNGCLREAKEEALRAKQMLESGGQIT